MFPINKDRFSCTIECTVIKDCLSSVSPDVIVFDINDKVTRLEIDFSMCGRTSFYCTILNINILEISQKIMDGFFTMMLVTDLSGCKQPLDEVSELLKTCAEGKTLSIRIQREDMFDAMYKL